MTGKSIVLKMIFNDSRRLSILIIEELQQLTAENIACFNNNVNKIKFKKLYIFLFLQNVVK